MEINMNNPEITIIKNGTLALCPLKDLAIETARRALASAQEMVYGMEYEWEDYAFATIIPAGEQIPFSHLFFQSPIHLNVRLINLDLSFNDVWIFCGCYNDDEIGMVPIHDGDTLDILWPKVLTMLQKCLKSHNMYFNEENSTIIWYNQHPMEEES
jgi:hypothetical protein